MAKVPKSLHSEVVIQFLKDLDVVFKLPTSKKHQSLVLPEYPFDLQLLSNSNLYRRSRKLYNSLGGIFNPRMCSTMRALSSQDLFKDEIDFSPSASEYLWFMNHAEEVYDPAAQVAAMQRFNEISLFHEQNHRIVWRVLPPAPKDPKDRKAFTHYLNFAESLVVTMDLALGDELGYDISNAFERLKILYRPGGEDKWAEKSKEQYRAYLVAIMYSTYMLLERVDERDILKALDYILPKQKKMNKDALERSLQLSEMFTDNTNLQWQSLFWQKAQSRLEEMHTDSDQEPLFLPDDPLDLGGPETQITQNLLNLFDL